MQVLYIHGEKEFMALSFPSNNAHLHFTFSCSPYILHWLFNVHNVKCTGWEDVQCKNAPVERRCSMPMCTGWSECSVHWLEGNRLSSGRSRSRQGREGRGGRSWGGAGLPTVSGQSVLSFFAFLSFDFFRETIFPTHNWEYEELDRGMEGQFEVGQYTHSYWGQSFHTTFWRQMSSERLIFGLYSS